MSAEHEDDPLAGARASLRDALLIALAEQHLAAQEVEEGAEEPPPASTRRPSTLTPPDVA